MPAIVAMAREIGLSLKTQDPAVRGDVVRPRLLPIAHARTRFAPCAHEAHRRAVLNDRSLRSLMPDHPRLAGMPVTIPAGLLAQRALGDDTSATRAWEGFNLVFGKKRSMFATSFSRITSRMKATNRFSRRPTVPRRSGRS